MKFEFLYVACVAARSSYWSCKTSRLSAVFLSFTQAVHTTHATQLFLDVTRHVSRTRVHACKHISRCASTRHLCLYFCCIAEKKKTKPRPTANRRNVRPFIVTLVLLINASHLIKFTFPNEGSINSKYRQNSLLMPVQYSLSNRYLRVKIRYFNGRFSQFGFRYLEGSARLPGHRCAHV